MQTAQHMRLGGRTELAARPHGLIMRQRPLIAPRVGHKPVLASSKRAEETGMHLLLPGEPLDHWCRSRSICCTE